MSFTILDFCGKHPIAIKEFQNFADELINDGAKNFAQLCYADKCELVGLLLQALDEPYEWLVESNDRDQTLMSLSIFMQNGTRDNKDNFIEHIRDQAVNYFSKHLNDYIVDLYEQHIYDVNEEYYRVNPHVLDASWHAGARR